MSNVNKVSPGVFFTLGGKERKLVFDFWAFYLLEKETGKNALNGEIFNNLSATSLLVLTWAAVQADEKLTLEQVGRMLRLVDLPSLSVAIQEAFEQAKPDEEKKADATNA